MLRNPELLRPGNFIWKVVPVQKRSNLYKVIRTVVLEIGNPRPKGGIKLLRVLNSSTKRSEKVKYKHFRHYYVSYDAALAAACLTTRMRITRAAKNLLHDCALARKLDKAILERLCES